MNTSFPFPPIGSAGTLRSALLLAGALTASSLSAQIVLMSGLNNPRGLAVAPDGSVYVSEAGAPFTPNESTPMIASTLGPAYYGNTGAIRRWTSGAQSTVLSNLPMLFNPANGDITGVHGLAATSAGDLYFTIGLGANPAARTADTPWLGWLAQLPAGSSTFTAVADIAAFEAANNPDGGPVDSNPYHLTLTSGGVLVTDAGANAVLSVDGSGNVSLVSTLPALPGGTDPVPTGLAAGAEGDYYVTQLTGFPFVPGSASLYHGMGASLDVLTSGFTNVIDLERGADGMLYLLEFATNGLLSGDTTGGLWRIDPETGARTLLMSDGLVLPTALAVGADGTVYVTNMGVMPGAGTLIAIAPIPEPSTYGLIGAAMLGAIVLWRRRR